MRPASARWASVLSACCAAVLAAGCPRAPTKVLPLEEVVGRYNANARAIPQLYAQAKMEIVILDGKGRPHGWGSTLLPPNARLLAARGEDPLGPHYFVLVVREAGQEIFRLGSHPDEDVYYFWARVGGQSGAWFGRHEFAGAPGIRELPFDPNQLLAVLGLFELPADFTKLPTVAVSLSTDPYAYVVTYVDHQPITRRVLFRRQVYFRWSDTEPPQAFRVDLFAPDGRRMVTASLGGYQPVPLPARDAKDAPTLPTDIRLQWVSWPDADGPRIQSVHLVLSDLSTQRGDPREASRYRENLPPGLKQVQVDAHLEPGGPAQ